MNRMRTFARVLTLAAVAVFVYPSVFAQNKTKQERREEANSRSVMGIVVGADDQAAAARVMNLATSSWGKPPLGISSST